MHNTVSVEISVVRMYIYFVLKSLIRIFANIILQMT